MIRWRPPPNVLLYRAVHLALDLLIVEFILFLVPPIWLRSLIFIVFSIPIVVVGASIFFDVRDARWYLRREFLKRGIYRETTRYQDLGLRIGGFWLMVISIMVLVTGLRQLNY